MKTAAVALDDWKLPVFKKRLDDAGYAYEQRAGIVKDTLTLIVKYKYRAELSLVIMAANAECASIKAARK